jgi:predicted HD phosphohydrolase
MTEEGKERSPHGVTGAEARPRRELLRLSLGALSSLLMLEKMSGCGQPGAPEKPPTSASVPSAPADASIPEHEQAGARAKPSAAAPAARQGEADGAQMGPDNVAPRTNEDVRPAFALACPRVTTFLPIADDGLRTRAVSTTQTDTLDWITIGLSGALFQTTVPDTLLDLLRQLGDLRLGHPLSLLDHSLQTATRARRAGASNDLVLAALLHHVGATLSVEGYAEISAAIARGYVSEDTYQIMRHHAEYAWAHFGALRGRPVDQRARYAGQAWHADAARLADDWERLAYDPAYPTLPLSEFEPLLRDKFSLITSELYTTHGDCI